MGFGLVVLVTVGVIVLVGVTVGVTVLVLVTVGVIVGVGVGNPSESAPHLNAPKSPPDKDRFIPE